MLRSIECITGFEGLSLDYTSRFKGLGVKVSAVKRDKDRRMLLLLYATRTTRDQEINDNCSARA
jgi:hypothetical protein